MWLNQFCSCFVLLAPIAESLARLFVVLTTSIVLSRAAMLVGVGVQAERPQPDEKDVFQVFKRLLESNDLNL